MCGNGNICSLYRGSIFGLIVCHCLRVHSLRAPEIRFTLGGMNLQIQTVTITGLGCFLLMFLLDRYGSESCALTRRLLY